MDIIIQSLGFKAGDDLEAYIREKLSKLNPNDHIVRANVILFLGPDKYTKNTYCEIRVEVPGNAAHSTRSVPVRHPGEADAGECDLEPPLLHDVARGEPQDLSVPGAEVSVRGHHASLALPRRRLGVIPGRGSSRSSGGPRR